MRRLKNTGKNFWRGVKKGELKVVPRAVLRVVLKVVPRGVLRVNAKQCEKLSLRS